MSSIISASQSKVSILSRALSQSAWGIVPNRTPRGSNCLVSMFHLDLHADDVRWSLVAQAIPENELFLSKMSIFRNRYIRAVMHAWSNFAKLERYFRPTVYSKAGRSILLSPMGKLVARGRAETIKIFYAWRINRVVYAHAQLNVMKWPTCDEIQVHKIACSKQFQLFNNTATKYGIHMDNTCIDFSFCFFLFCTEHAFSVALRKQRLLFSLTSMVGPFSEYTGNRLSFCLSYRVCMASLQKSINYIVLTAVPLVLTVIKLHDSHAQPCTPIQRAWSGDLQSQEKACLLQCSLSPGVL